MNEGLPSPQGNEIQPDSKAVTREAVALADSLVGASECSGDHPYKIKFLDNSDRKGYLIQIRKDPEWMTISLQVSDNPMLVRSFLFQNKNSEWEYEDPYLAKYGEPSTDELLVAVGVLRKVVEMSKSPEIEGDQDLPLPPHE